MRIDGYSRKLLDAAAEELAKAEKLITVARAAERADVATRTVRRWIASGKLRHVRSATGRLRVYEQEVKAFIAAQL